MFDGAIPAITAVGAEAAEAFPAFVRQRPERIVRVGWIAGVARPGMTDDE